MERLMDWFGDFLNKVEKKRGVFVAEVIVWGIILGIIQVYSLIAVVFGILLGIHPAFILLMIVGGSIYILSRFISFS